MSKEVVDRVKESGSDGKLSTHTSPGLKLNELNELDLNDLSIEIRNLKFTYDKSRGYLLDSINLTFPKSAIYGLLGASGCGKTTLIKLIVGRLTPSSGTIRVNGKPVSDPSNKIPGVGIGYMPQDIALFKEMTIYETLNYFSKIYGLQKDFREKRIQFMIKFLDLPEQNRGGQKRRTSLAVAIIHSPPLLILDEPTVGVDPVLRERIWEYLIHLSSDEKTSILLTTHYIEECRRAHAIALMRNGKVLAENSPKNLLTHFQTDNLEDVFLRVCRIEESKVKNTLMPPNLAQMRGTDGSTRRPVKTNDKPLKGSSVCQRLSALCQKNFMIHWRQKPLMLLEMVLPMFAIILMGLSFGKKPYDLDIALFNEETLKNPMSNMSLSEVFLQQIDKKTIVLHNFKTNDSAFEAVRDGSMYGELAVGQNFTKALMRRKAEGISVTDEVIDQSTIKFYGDLTDISIFVALFQTLLEANMKFMLTMFEAYGKQTNTNGTGGKAPNPKAMNPIIEVVDPGIYGSRNSDLGDFVSSGLLIFVSFILAAGLTTLSTIIERREGLFERTVIAGVKTHEILIAQLAIQMILMTLQTILSMIAVFAINRTENKGNYLLIAVLLLLQGICGMTFGLLISSISTTTMTAVLLLVGPLIPYVVISGIVWPLEALDKEIQWFSLATPLTIPIKALRAIIFKGWDITRPIVMLGYVVIIIWIILIFILSTLFNNLRKD